MQPESQDSERTYETPARRHYRLHEPFIDRSGDRWDSAWVNHDLEPTAGGLILLPTGEVVPFEPADPAHERGVAVERLGRDLREPLEIIRQRDTRITAYRRENAPPDVMAATRLRRRLAVICEDARNLGSLAPGEDEDDLRSILCALEGVDGGDVCDVTAWTSIEGMTMPCDHRAIAHAGGACVLCMVTQPGETPANSDGSLADLVPVDLPVAWQHEFQAEAAS